MVDSALVRSTVFGIRNIDNSQKGHVGKTAVAGGQIRNAIVAAREVDGVVGQSATTFIDTCKTLSKQEKVFELAGKALNLAGKYVNPLIVVSSGIDVAMSDDKEKTFVENSIALGAMFAMENYMKKHLADVVKIKGISNIAEKITKATENTKYGKYVAPVTHGLAFVVGSCTAYAAGNKFGSLLMGDNKA